MLTSKRQEWILQMIKGPEIAPVSNSPGHYTSQSIIRITAGDQEITVSPADVLDLSSAEFLMIKADDGCQYRIAWEHMTALDFEPKMLRARTGAHRVMAMPLGK